jgi:hypothetical protein
VTLPVVLRPLANADVQQIHAEREAQAAGLGGKFLDRLQETLDHIEAMPEMDAEVWGTVRAARSASAGEVRQLVGNGCGPYRARAMPVRAA